MHSRKELALRLEAPGSSLAEQEPGTTSFPSTGNINTYIPNSQQPASITPSDAGTWPPLTDNPNVGMSGSQPRRRESICFLCEETESDQSGETIQIPEDVESNPTDSSSTVFEPEPERPEVAILVLEDVCYTENEAHQHLARQGVMTGSVWNIEPVDTTVMIPLYSRNTANGKSAWLDGLRPFPANADPVNLLFSLGDFGYYGMGSDHAISR